MTKAVNNTLNDQLFLSELVAETDRYHLYISQACPFSHRAYLVLSVLGLEGVLDVSSVAARRHDRGWEFDDVDQDPLHKETALLSTLYEGSRPGFTGNQSVPVLWDKYQERIVHNDSADLAWQMATRLLPLAKTPMELVPDDLSDEIASLNDWLHTHVNRMVYTMGFASDQQSYSKAFTVFFNAMDELEARLADQRYLFGNRLTLSDLFLLPTLIRFEAVYCLHFKANLRPLQDYPALYDYLRRMTQREDVRRTIDMDHIKLHYYYSHNHINPTRIVPDGPQLAWLAQSA
ncbi:glutathione S-transferase C-terminal domain-containing protein [Pseudomonas sp. CVAP|uniref:glutathione S-transferase C-terminal domain-containing protein n=1 Tax=Pseudomonas sp. CVAP\|nr:glutathione S-transferase C-terminal domain-containing protein [Pseudomonas sp. CVAP\